MVEKLDIIYLFGYSPRMQTQLKQLNPIIKSQIAKDIKVGVVFIHNGVIGTSIKGEIPNEIKVLTLSNNSLYLYVMIPDLKARGILIKDVIEKFKPIEYDTLVELLDQANKIISWM